MGCCRASWKENYGWKHKNTLVLRNHDIMEMERSTNMHKQITYAWIADKCICLLLILSMLSVVNIEIAGFPLYNLLLFILASAWMMCRIIYAGKDRISFLTVRYPTDTAAMAVILYAFFGGHKAFQYFGRRSNRFFMECGSNCACDTLSVVFFATAV